MNIECQLNETDFFLLVATEMENYTILAQCLGIPDTKLDEIKRDNTEEKTRKFAVLKAWKRQNGCDATYAILVVTLLKINDRHTAEVIIGYCKKHISSKCQTAKEKENIVENEAIQYQYTSMVTNVCKSFHNCNVNPDQVKVTLLSYRCIPHAERDRKIVQDNMYPELKSGCTIDEVLVAVAKHSSWYNFRLLEIVINQHGSDEDKQALFSYQNDILKPYLKRSILDVPSEFLASVSGMSYVPCLMMTNCLPEKQYSLETTFQSY